MTSWNPAEVVFYHGTKRVDRLFGQPLPDGSVADADGPG
jgi:hypothetical protein